MFPQWSGSIFDPGAMVIDWFNHFIYITSCYTHIWVSMIGSAVRFIRLTVVTFWMSICPGTGPYALCIWSGFELKSFFFVQLCWTFDTCLCIRVLGIFLVNLQLLIPMINFLLVCHVFWHFWCTTQGVTFEPGSQVLNLESCIFCSQHSIHLQPLQDSHNKCLILWYLCSLSILQVIKFQFCFHNY